MATQLADAVVEVNDDVVGIVPNSLSFTEGKGEQRVLPVSEGGGRVSQLFANDLESNFATVSFSVRVTTVNIAKLLAWKENANRNLVTIAGEDPDGSDVIRTFSQAAFTSDYEVPIQAEGVVDVVFMANAPT